MISQSADLEREIAGIEAQVPGSAEQRVTKRLEPNRQVATQAAGLTAGYGLQSPAVHVAQKRGGNVHHPIVSVNEAVKGALRQNGRKCGIADAGRTVCIQTLHGRRPHMRRRERCQSAPRL